MPCCLGRWVCVLFVALAASWLLMPLPAASLSDTEEITILRDDFGIPHIFGQTEEGAAFGMGYAQAEDRLEEIFKQYRRAEGTMSEVFGPENLQDDYRQRRWQHRAVAEANYDKQSPKARAIAEAYQAGLKQYMSEHPQEVPSWAPELHSWQIVALGRYIIWGWPEGSAAGDLERAGIKPDPIPERGSNEWTITPSRTAQGAPLALIDPHLGWYGAFRFYESRLYGGELQMSGMSIPGLPIPALGHSAYCSIAMTTGGPDTSDVYEEEVNPDNPRQYRYDGHWRDMTVRPEVIRVKDGNEIKERRFEIESTHHGPVVARRNGKAYAMKLPYADEFRLSEQTLAMATAKNVAEMKKALAMLQLMEQNIMVATVDGDIFYVRNGRVPIRPKGFDWTHPVPGNTTASEWLGIHEIDDLLQSLNPWQGYMQNCNVSPEFMMKFSPMTLERYADRPYLYNTDNPLHQRAAMVLNLLDMNSRFTLRDAFDLSMNPQVYNADLWQARLVNAWQKADTKLKADPNTAKVFDEIVRWNRRADADSTGAVAYRYWKDQIWTDKKILLADRAGQPIPKQVTDDLLLQALVAGAKTLHADWGRLDVKYGDVYRVGRKGGTRTWPVSGGSVEGLATPRAIGFDKLPDKKTFLARGGQTSTQVVQLTKPPRSWTLLPLGESDHPDSKHWDDQAEKLFSPGKLKPTYFLNKEELLKHVESKKVLHRPAS